MDGINSGFTTTNNNVASRLLAFDIMASDNKYNKSDNYAFVTELTAYHLTGRYQKQYILDILFQIEIADGISEFEKTIDQMKEVLRKKKNELRDKRDHYFVVHNKDTEDIYGELADNINTHDRDLYIKELVNYYDIIKSLKEISKEQNAVSCSLKENANQYFHNIEDDSGQPFHEMQDSVIIFLDDVFSSNSVRIDHSSSLYGDLCAVHNLMCDISSKVPDLTFNCGNIQID